MSECKSLAARQLAGEEPRIFPSGSGGGGGGERKEGGKNEGIRERNGKNVRNVDSLTVSANWFG